MLEKLTYMDLDIIQTISLTWIWPKSGILLKSWHKVKIIKCIIIGGKPALLYSALCLGKLGHKEGAISYSYAIWGGLTGFWWNRILTPRARHLHGARHLLLEASWNFLATKGSLGCQKLLILLANEATISPSQKWQQYKCAKYKYYGCSCLLQQQFPKANVCGKEGWF